MDMTYEGLEMTDYKKHYTRGWRASGRVNASLDRGDANNEPDAWYDGYHDYASSRAKWHTLTHWESDICVACGHQKCQDGNCDWSTKCRCRWKRMR